jgi:HEPN domain-containing protein
MNRWKDWLDQGKRDLERAGLDREHRFYEWACFTSQQAAEKALKGLALKLGMTVWGHSLTEIFRILSERIEVAEDLKDKRKSV